MFPAISPQFNKLSFLTSFLFCFRGVGKVCFIDSSMRQFLQISQGTGRNHWLNLDTAHNIGEKAEALGLTGQ